MERLDEVIERDAPLCRLAVLRQDTRDFGWEKRAVLEPSHAEGPAFFAAGDACSA